MEMESLNDVYFVLALFVPGFVYWSVLRQFVPLRKLDGSESLLLSYLSATVLMYALWSPFILWVMSATTSSHLVASPFQILVIFCSLVLIGPSLLAVFRAYTIQKDIFSGLLTKLHLRTVHPIPTAWDWKFSRTSPSYVLVTLIDGKIIAGWLGLNSLASSDPDRRDLFLEKVFTIPPDGSPWVETPGTSGVYIDGKQIAHIEFRG